MKNYLLIFAVLQIWSALATIQPTIRIWGDVREYPEFFRTTVPYLMDSFGGFLMVEFYLMGHGIYAQSQNCAIKQLKGNYFLAAYYLKCEAEGKDPDACVCESGIDEAVFRKCVRDEGQSLVKNAYWTYSRSYGTDWGPIIDFGPLGNPKWQITGADRPLQEYFDKFCGLFTKKNRPVLCLLPLTSCPQRRGPAMFECGGEAKPKILPEPTDCTAVQVQPYQGTRRRSA